MKKEKYIILPIREPWASMIANGIKPFEFRCWIPKWFAGQKILIVATGNAKKPREIIAVAEYGGCGVVKNIRRQTIGNCPKYLIIEPILVHQVSTCTDIKFRVATNNEIVKWGGSQKDYALKLNNVKRITPIKLQDLGIVNTPQKYQYYESDKKLF